MKTQTFDVVIEAHKTIRVTVTEDMLEGDTSLDAAEEAAKEIATENFWQLNDSEFATDMEDGDLTVEEVESVKVAA